MITIWGILTTIIISSFLIIIYIVLSKEFYNISFIGLPIFFIFLIVIIIRMTVFIEFPFSKVIASTNILPQIDLILRMPLYIFPNQFIVNLYFIISSIWISVIVIKVFLLIQAHYKLNKSLKLLTKKNIDSESYTNLSSELKFPSKILFLETEAISVPFVYGFFYPVIVFPKINYNYKEEYFIIKHELEHYKNKDIWIKTFVELLCSIYWWNPLVYLLRNKSYCLLEMNVDRAVIRISEEMEKLEYLSFLLNTYKGSRFESKTKKNALLSRVVLNKNKTEIIKRFSMILSPQKPKHLIVILTSIFSCILILCSYLYVVQPQYPLPDDIDENLILSAENAYLIKNSGGSYDVYFYTYGYIETIELPYSGLKIINEKEEK